MQKSGLTLHAIASQEHVTPGYVSRLLRLPLLAPDIVTAIINKDYPVIQGIILVLGFLAIILNLLVDVILGIIDPRTLGGGKNHG